MQEFVAFLIVAVAAAHLIKRSKLHLAIARQGSEWLLARGKVKWAFRLRELAKPKPAARKDCH